MQGNGTDSVPFGLDQQRVREGLDRARSLIDRTDEQVRALASEQPLLFLGGALVAGYLIGRIITRR